MDSPDHITADALLDRLRAEGVAVTREQLSRWQREGLIPRPTQHGLGRGVGSEVRYPLHAPAQVRRCAELMEQSRRVERVGWRLWWEGFDVDERHWRPVLASAETNLRRGTRFIALWFRIDAAKGALKTGQDEIATSNKAAAPFNLIWHRSLPDERARFVRLLAQVCTGEAVAGEYHEQSENDADTDAFMTLSAMSQHARDIIGGARFEFAPAIPAVLNTLAACVRDLAQSAPGEFNHDAGLNAARDYLHAAVSLASNLYQATEWIYGQSAFGLKMLVRTLDNAPPMAGAITLLMWLRYIRHAGMDILPAEEIVQLRIQTETTLRDAQRLRALAAKPEFKPLFEKRRLRKALKSEVEMRAFLAQVRAARGARW